MLQAVRETKTIEKVVYTSSFFALGPTDGYVADETQVQRFCNYKLLPFFLAKEEEYFFFFFPDYLLRVPQTTYCDDRSIRRNISAPSTRNRRLLLIRLH